MWLARHPNERWLAPHSIVSLFPVNEYVLLLNPVWPWPFQKVALKQQMRTGPAEENESILILNFSFLSILKKTKVFELFDSRHCICNNLFWRQSKWLALAKSEWLAP